MTPPPFFLVLRTQRTLKREEMQKIGTKKICGAFLRNTVLGFDLKLSLGTTKVFSKTTPIFKKINKYSFFTNFLFVMISGVKVFILKLVI